MHRELYSMYFNEDVVVVEPVGSCYGVTNAPQTLMTNKGD
jgi:hypothetical protein